MAVLVEAGIEVVGENRAQDLEAKHAEYGDAFRWHFIGRLQSNKVKVVNRMLRARALARLALGGGAARGAGARAGEPGGRGVEGRDRAGRDRRLPRATTCAASRRCRRRPPTRRRRGRGSRGCASSPPSTASRELSMGTTQDYRVAAEEGATSSGSAAFSSCNALGLRSTRMSFGDLWNRTLVYFGIAEEDEECYDDDEAYAAEESLEQSYRERPNVRRLTPRRRSHELRRLDGVRGGPSAPAPAPARRRPRRRRARRARAATSRRCRTRTRCASISCCRAASTTRSRSPTSSSTSIPVILNLQNADAELSKRLIDFASGLTYALDGGHAAGRRQGVPAHAAKRRGQRRAARAAARARRLLQPGVGIEPLAGPKAARDGPRRGQPRSRSSSTSSSRVYMLAIFLYVLTSWIRLPYSLQPGSALPVRRLRPVPRVCGGGSCRRSARSTSRRSSASSA